ncbi:MAG: hypothetical protein RIT24_469 [Planctomycetota bacterium]|jgi:general secretion pathway protein G
MNHTARRKTSPATRRDDGFTLIEIMVVILIIGLLATFVAPNVISMGDGAKVTKAQGDIKILYDQAKIYRFRNSKIPTLEDLTTPDAKGHSYIENMGKDPWDNDYVIREIDRNTFEVVSWGPDRQEGTEDDLSSKGEKK